MVGWLRTLARLDEDEGALGRHGALLASLVLLLVAMPIGRLVFGGTPHFPLLLIGVLVAAVVVTSRQPWIFAVAILVGSGAAAGILIGEATGEATARIAADGLALSLLGFTSLVMLNSLIQSDEVSPDMIVGGICVYLLIGLCFALSFNLLTEYDSGAFAYSGEAVVRATSGDRSHDARLLYFSFVTLTTLGFGDIVPRSELAQMFAVTEAITGQLYLTIFMARLIGLFVGLRRERFR
jgi:voltage-gated potassium channel